MRRDSLSLAAPTSAPLEPAPAPPVRLQGRMTPKGYEAENSAWKPFLTYPDKRLGTRADGSPRLAGCDPMKLPLDGHPRRQARLCLRLATRTA